MQSFPRVSVEDPAWEEGAKNYFQGKMSISLCNVGQEKSVHMQPGVWGLLKGPRNYGVFYAQNAFSIILEILSHISDT